MQCTIGQGDGTTRWVNYFAPRTKRAENPVSQLNIPANRGVLYLALVDQSLK
jgi:hypothetical protein